MFPNSGQGAYAGGAQGRRNHAVARVLMVALALGVLAVQGIGVAGASAKPSPLKHVLVPNASVLEWFSPLHPKAGQHETVYARLWIGKKPVAGAHLVAIVREGSHVVHRVRGTTTNKRGQAHARFSVPRSMKGKTLTVRVTLTFRRSRIFGSDKLIVR